MRFVKDCRAINPMPDIGKQAIGKFHLRRGGQAERITWLGNDDRNAMAMVNEALCTECRPVDELRHRGSILRKRQQSKRSYFMADAWLPDLDHRVSRCPAGFP